MNNDVWLLKFNVLFSFQMSTKCPNGHLNETKVGTDSLSGGNRVVWVVGTEEWMCPAGLNGRSLVAMRPRRS